MPKMWCTVAIHHRYRTDDILSHLRTIANSKDIGIFRLNAEMQLQKIERQLKASKEI